MARILLLGASGQLGTEIQRADLPRDWTLVAASREQIDFANLDSIADAITATRPDAIINAAGYTGVDRAESEADLAFALNRDAAGLVAEAAARAGAALVHLSTDYVFDGSSASPYVESDQRNPINAYGRSKAEGELAVLDVAENLALVRTSWVYSPFRTNFVRTMLNAAQTRDEIGVVSDQLGRPTSARDLAAACVAVSQRLLDGDQSARGILHYSGAGDATWADFAEFIFAQSAARGGKPARVRRLLTAEYPTPATRPANSRLDTMRAQALGIAVRDWRESAAACVAELLGR